MTSARNFLAGAVALASAFASATFSPTAIAASPKPIIMGAAPNETVTEIRGVAPLRVQLRGVYSMHDVGDYGRCLALGSTLPSLPKYSPEGVVMENCLRDQMKLVSAANQKILGNAESVTHARFQWNMGMAVRERRVPDSARTYVLERQEGFAAGYVYDEPGTYYVNLRVTNSDGVGADAAPVKIVVLARPADHRVVFVDALTGNDANDGATSARAIRSLPRAQQLAVDGAELLLKRGQIFPLTASLNFDQSDLRVASYGEGEKPVIMWSEKPIGHGGAMIYLNSPSAGPFMYQTRNVVFEDIAFDTDLVAIFGKAEYYEKAGVPDAVVSHTRGLLMRNVTFRNVSAGIMNNAKGQDILLLGSSAPLDHGLRAYLIWNEGINVHIIGSRCANSTREHCARSTSGHLFTVNALNDFENKDFRGTVDPGDFSKSVANNQMGFNFYMRGNLYTSGDASFGPLGGGDGRGGQLVGFGVFEANELRNGGQIQGQDGSIDVMVRNNLVHASFAPGINIQGYDATYVRGMEDIVVAHNTVDLQAQKGNCFIVQKTERLVFKNNLCVNTQLDTAGYGSGVFQTGEPDMSFARDFSGNLYDYPKTYKKQPFVSAVDPVAVFGNGQYVTEATWLTQQRQLGFTPADRFFAFTSSDFAPGDGFIPAGAGVDMKAGSPAPGVFTDRFDNLRSRDGGWVGAASDPGEDISAARKPLKLQAKRWDTLVDISWEVNGAGVFSYLVAFAPGDVPPACDGGKNLGDVRRFRAESLKPKTHYAFSVCSVAPDGRVSAPSTLLVSTRERMAPPLPTNFTVDRITRGSARLNWSSGGTNTAQFWVVAKQTGVFASAKCADGARVGNINSVTLGNLSAGKKYVFAVCAESQSGVLGPAVKIKATLPK